MFTNEDFVMFLIKQLILATDAITNITQMKCCAGVTASLIRTYFVS